MKKKAVVLLSGGMDSSVVLAEVTNRGFEVHAITFRYGQRHAIEIESAKKQAKRFKVKEHTVFELNLAQFGGSALTDNIDVPKETGSAEIPVTYVPARNTVFLSVALSYAETLDAKDIFIGVSAVDYSGYPDCRPAFIKSFEQTANLGTRAADGGEQYKVHAPLVSLTKEETVRLGESLGVNFKDTHTCYDPGDNGEPCGKCDSCRLRIKGFDEANRVDPVNK